MALTSNEIQSGLSIVRAIASYTPGSVIICPAIDITQLVLGGYASYEEAQAQEAQNDWQNSVLANLTSLKNSVGVLQATTAVIGVGVAAGVALSAVNLYQTLKLREDVKQLRLEVKDGFIDMKQALKDQGKDIIQQIDKVAQDVEFRHHRTILAQAYGRFLEALNCIQDAMISADINGRNSDLENAKGMLRNALADYNNPRLFEDTISAGQLRRRECAWAIDQTITTTYQLQGAYEVVSKRLLALRNKIRQDVLSIIDTCKSEDELDFLFPEIMRIHDHDLAALGSWQSYVDWRRSLSSEELKLLSSDDFRNSELTIGPEATINTTVDLVLPEQQLYDNLKQKSHYQSLRDQLKFMLKPDLRRTHESYISQQAIASNYKALAPSNWEAIPDLTVANLYWYFKQAQA